MFPNITNHYHAFGRNSGNNSGDFIATNESVTYPISAGFGTRGWNGSGGGGGFSAKEGQANANMVTSLAVHEESTQKVQPASLELLPAIKF